MASRTGKEILDAIKQDAVEWATAEGLKRPVRATNAIVTDFGFKVTAIEEQGNKMATCTFLCDGTRSMYELDKKGY